MYFLLNEQRSDGSWTGQNRYGLVPTLSATEALLSVVRNPPAQSRPPIRRGVLTSSVHRGLDALFRRLNVDEPAPLPDTVAVEIVVPSLIAEINSHLDQDLPIGLEEWRGRRLIQHPGGNIRLLAGLRAAVGRGHPLPMKLLHSLEIYGDAARGARLIDPMRCNVGCSPAATAVWLGDSEVRAGCHPGVRYLEAVQRRGGGPVPVAAPLAVFERVWVLCTLAGAGLVPRPYRGLVRSLHAAFGEFGVAGGPGLPPDADDTATALSALARLGSPRSPEVLWVYRAHDGHFACFPDERTPSTSTNAHVLQSFGDCLRLDPPQCTRYADAMARITAWLCERQEADGSWSDKWHASPYYATACAALALARYGGDLATGTLAKAVDWLLDTQRPDGSWGRWAGTCEETAYAVQVLARVRTVHAGEVTGRALGRGCEWLRRDGEPPYPPLWHDKDLYTPTRIVRAEGLAALRLAASSPHFAPAEFRPVGKESR
ncbi:MAG TPA: prenyltransferase/squalene oxidase repeat-containing protein [Actinophytocola sp.]|uniref:prenyltransferase/squalene oxidase repeat-containing protein n=1 Tax=Actinophytocola sp. TaxID=1872138 RepID=UPI002DDCEA1E|nr:prenyltransferase/squalene oxidase repeat-containing protein [Actinophytocola sp.]HEV2778251.1 prenyltransferase/squalene oxidase repeat-containing protein [Actinophytocola sp.]